MPRQTSASSTSTHDPEIFSAALNTLREVLTKGQVDDLIRFYVVENGTHPVAVAHAILSAQQEALAAFLPLCGPTIDKLLVQDNADELLVALLSQLDSLNLEWINLPFGPIPSLINVLNNRPIPLQSVPSTSSSSSDTPMAPGRWPKLSPRLQQVVLYLIAKHLRIAVEQRLEWDDQVVRVLPLLPSYTAEEVVASFALITSLILVAYGTWHHRQRQRSPSPTSSKKRKTDLNVEIPRLGRLLPAKQEEEEDDDDNDNHERMLRDALSDAHSLTHDISNAAPGTTASLAYPYAARILAKQTALPIFLSLSLHKLLVLTDDPIFIDYHHQTVSKATQTTWLSFLNSNNVHLVLDPRFPALQARMEQLPIDGPGAPLLSAALSRVLRHRPSTIEVIVTAVAEAADLDVSINAPFAASSTLASLHAAIKDIPTLLALFGSKTVVIRCSRCQQQRRQVCSALESPSPVLYPCSQRVLNNDGRLTVTFRVSHDLTREEVVTGARFLVVPYKEEEVREVIVIWWGKHVVLARGGGVYIVDGVLQHRAQGPVGDGARAIVRVVD